MDDPRPEPAIEPSWQQPLEELERIFQDATRALGALRRVLEEPDAKVEASAEGKGAFERLWQRLDREKLGQGAELSPELEERLHGLELLPKHCMVTVEDRERAVDLVPLHRSLLTLAKQDDIELVSYVNGTAVISIRTTGALDPDRLGEVVAGALGQELEVIPQGEERIFLRVGHPGEEGVAS